MGITRIFKVRYAQVTFEIMEKISEIYPGLYHYTNKQGLYGILENQCVRATHYKFLNDYSEIELFRKN